MAILMDHPFQECYHLVELAAAWKKYMRAGTLPSSWFSKSIYEQA
jgi:hypothetical protein